MKDVQERLGHFDIQTTMNIYTHVTENSREIVLNCLRIMWGFKISKHIPKHIRQ